jgi:hypothetical protein
VNGRDRTKLIHGVLGQIEVIRSVLPASTYARVPIEAALAWSKGEALPLLGSVRLEGVLIDGKLFTTGYFERVDRFDFDPPADG